MADISLKFDSRIAVTCVSNIFIDNYMAQADGEFVKIYLYLLRCIDNRDASFSISSIADKFDYTEKDVKRALKYWEKMQLLRLEFDKKEHLTGICLTDAQHPAGTDTAAKPDLTQFKADRNVQELLYVAERYLGRQLNHVETEKILYWLDKLKFSQDLIEYLIEQCLAKGHADIPFMDKTALSWAKQGIHTLAEAKNVFTDYSQTARVIKKAFGIAGRNLADYEEAYVQKWAGTMQFSDEAIALACQKTLRSTQKISFPYADTILENWQEQNVHTLTEIELLDAKHQKAQSKKYAAAKITAVQASMRTTKKASVNGYSSFPQRTYDYAALERELLTR